MVQVTNVDSTNAVATANDLAMSSDLVATIPPPTDFGLSPSPVVAAINTTEISGSGQYPSTSAASPLRHHFGLSGESGIQWLESPSRQPPVTPVRSGHNVTEQSPGVHFDLKM